MGARVGSVASAKVVAVCLLSCKTRLPLEISDYIVDLLCSEPGALKSCCLVSKSWVPRVRKHLFAEVAFRTPVDLKTWKQTFPDPANSPAYYTRSLVIGYPKVLLATVVEESGWVQAFSNVVRLRMGSGERSYTLAFFHGSSLVLVFRCVGLEAWVVSRLFDLVCSLPLLEDLDVKGFAIVSDAVVFHPSASPRLTGTLRLNLRQWSRVTTRLLSDLPNGVHFRKLECVWCLQYDIECVSVAVEVCSDTLECVSIECGNHGTRQFLLWTSNQLTSTSTLVIPQAGAVGLSQARRLKEVVFRLRVLNDV